MTRTELLLITLSEECNETAQRVSKALRFTLEEIQDGQTFNNAERIVYEFNDIAAVMEILKEEGLVEKVIDREAIELKKVKVKKWLQYSEKVGTLECKETHTSLCTCCGSPHYLRDEDAGSERELRKECVFCYDKYKTINSNDICSCTCPHHSPVHNRCLDCNKIIKQ